MIIEKPKTESVPEEGVRHRSLAVERTLGSYDLIEQVADYSAAKIHAPCIVNLATGEVAELTVYDQYSTEVFAEGVYFVLYWSGCGYPTEFR